MRLVVYCIVLFLTIFPVSAILAQEGFEPVDMIKIEALVDDASLPTFYPLLLQRFNAFDTSLTPADYRLLYYGFAFQPRYRGYACKQRRPMKQAVVDDDYVAVSKIADSVMSVVPISLSAHYFKAYALMNMDQDKAYKRYLYQYNHLRNALLSSGDGLQCNTAFKAIFLDDEYEIMYRYFEIDIGGHEALPHSCSRYVVASAGAYVQKEIFFDTAENGFSLNKALRASSIR